MLTLLAGLLVWVPALVGWGYTILPALLGGRLGEDDEAELALAGFSGLGLLAVVGAALNLVMGLGPALSAGAAVLGLVLFARGRRGLSLMERHDAFGLALLALLIATYGSGPLRLYDTGLYHFSAVKWSVTGPLPAGLANLHRRFGFDTLWFPAAALLELPGFSGLGAWLVSAAAIFFFGSAVLAGLKRTIRGTADAAGVLLACGAVPMVVVAITKGLPSLSTDLPVTLLTILSAQFLLRETSGAAERRAAVALAFLAVTVKLSAGVFLLGLVLAVRTFPAALLFGAVPWLIRGITLSGYVFYPVIATRLAFLPWATPASIAKDEADWVQSWARMPKARPEVVNAGWAWLEPWARANVSRLSVVALVLLLAAGVAALLLVRRRGTPRAPRTGPRAAAFAAALSTIFWFLTAPDARFGYGALFVLAALPVALAVPEMTLAAWPARLRAFLAAAAGIGLAGVSALLLHREHEWFPTLLVPPAVPTPYVREHETADGERVWVPVDGDRCWDAPLPCTPYFRRELRIDLDLAGRPRVFSFPPAFEPESRARQRAPK